MLSVVTSRKSDVVFFGSHVSAWPAWWATSRELLGWAGGSGHSQVCPLEQELREHQAGSRAVGGEGPGGPDAGNGPQGGGGHFHLRPRGTERPREARWLWDLCLHS